MLSYREVAAYALWGFAVIAVVYGVANSLTEFRISLVIALILIVIGAIVYFAEKITNLHHALEAHRISSLLIDEVDEFRRNN